MNKSFVKIYSADEEVKSAYFLKQGKIFIYISNEDKYSLSGKNLIIGATELLVDSVNEPLRIETVITDKESTVEKIPKENFFEGLKKFSFLLNSSMVLAKEVSLTNKILNKNMESLQGEDKKIQKLSVEYYNIADSIRQEFNKRKFPWLKTIVGSAENELTYKKGEAFAKSSPNSVIAVSQEKTGNSIEFKRDEIICEENTPGDEMFILQSGEMDVYIGDNKVATINQTGTVFGEIGLLLGENRTATLKAKNNVLITKISKDEIKTVAEKNLDVFVNIHKAMAKRHYFNVVKIKAINEQLISKTFDQKDEIDKKNNLVHKIEKDLRKFKTEIEETARKNNGDFLDELIKSF